MKRFLLSMLAVAAMTLTASAQDKLYATPGNLPGGANATLGLYTWTATNNNLMTIFTFENGELADYTTLNFKLSALDGGMVRVGYYVGDTFTEFTNADGNKGFGSSGDKSIDLTTQGVDLSTVTRIVFGGKTLSGETASVSIEAKNTTLNGGDGKTLVASFGNPGGNATYYDYTWTNTSNNLWPLFEFANGELANYATLKFSLSNKTADSGMLRVGVYVGSTWTEFSNADGNKGFGSAGDKSIDLTVQDIDLSTVTKICIGGKTGTGSVNIRNIYVEKGNTDGISSVKTTTNNDNIYYNMSGQRVAQPTRGLYIVNGKKVVLK